MPDALRLWLSGNMAPRYQMRLGCGMTEAANEKAELTGGSASTELAENRTAMAFDRTDLANHRTLLAMMRTSLSLISFGFTIFKFFTAMAQQAADHTMRAGAPRMFGTTMVVLGVVILLFGILDHYRATKALEKRKRRLIDLGLARTDMPGRIASSTMVALAVLLLGLMALANIVFRIGPE